MHPAKFDYRHIGREAKAKCYGLKFLHLIVQNERTPELDKTDTGVRAKEVIMKNLKGSGSFHDKFIRKYRAIPIS